MSRRPPSLGHHCSCRTWVHLQMRGATVPGVQHGLLSALPRLSCSRGENLIFSIEAFYLSGARRQEVGLSFGLEHKGFKSNVLVSANAALSTSHVKFTCVICGTVLAKTMNS